MKRYLSVAAWIALSVLTIDPSFAASDAPAGTPPVAGQQAQAVPTDTGIAKTPVSAANWQAREMARYANQKRAAERRQLELSKGDAPPTTPADTTVAKKKRSGGKRVGKRNN